ncbi:MAG: alanine racemase [Treponema sp.]|nr:alanine racemase [Treponema sp.]
MKNVTTRAVIYKKNLENNISEIKKLLKPETKMCVAVKADGYGTSALETARLCEKLGVYMLAIARVSEGIELRKDGIKLPLLLLSLCCPEEFPDLVKYNITPFIFGKEHIQALEDSLTELEESKGIIKTLEVHLAIDTGMGRIGCRKEEAAEQAKLIASSKHLKLSGMGTHFALSDCVEEKGIDYTNLQFEIFTEAVNAVKEAGIEPGICHAGASAIACSRSDIHFDMVRPGIIVYGYYADQVDKKYLESKDINLDLKPIMQFETKVSAIRRFKPGQSVSYGRTWICEEETDIAVLPVGYADGLLRRFSPGLKVAINGKEYPVVGRICMDQCMVNIGKDNKEIKCWDKAVIFGPVGQDGALQDAETLAALGNTISYEVMTSISKRVPRIVVDNC